VQIYAHIIGDKEFKLTCTDAQQRPGEISEHCSEWSVEFGQNARH